jgi:MFS family permease
VLVLLKRIALDFTPVRRSRPFRILCSGEVVGNVGKQAALVALPYQIFVLSHSPTLVGLLGAFELGPMIVVSLVGGAMNDRMDRRLLLALAQVAVFTMTAALAVVALIGHPPVLLVLVLGGVLAGGVALDGVSSSAMIPGMLGPELLRPGLAFSYGLSQLCGIVGPAVGGLMIATAGVGGTYIFDAASCVAVLAAAIAIGPQHPVAVEQHPPVLHSIKEGLAFVRRNNALSGSFAIDLVAMTFGMPRALFAVLSLTVYHAGASGTGFLYSAVAAGGTLAVLSSGWVAHARRLGRIVIYAVLAWGAAIAAAGLVRTIWPAVVLLAVAGWADGISAVCRSTINQAVTTEEMRGRMSSVFSLVVTSGPRFGDMESGIVAGLSSALTSVVAGGVACIAGVGAIVLAFPKLASFDADETIAANPSFGE